MGTSPELSLEILARTDAKEFIKQFLIANNVDEDLSPARIEVKCKDFEADGIALTLVDSVGGYEGQGEYVRRVFEVTKHGTNISFVAITGFYSSYSGIDWDADWTIVYPKQVLQTVYTIHP